MHALLTTADVAMILGISVWSVHRLRREGRLRALKYPNPQGGISPQAHWHFYGDSLAEFLGLSERATQARRPSEAECEREARLVAARIGHRGPLGRRGPRPGSRGASSGESDGP
jgi:hypothetical protein